MTYPTGHPGLQFPTADKEAWNQATRARYDEFDTLENALLQAEAGGQAIDKIGPVIAVTNSAGGWRALLSALKAKSDNMKGIVAYETPGFVFPGGRGARAQAECAVRSQFRAAGRVHEADEVSDPDGVRRLHRHAVRSGKTSVEVAQTFCDIVNRHGGDCEVLLLPDAGLRGNTHIAFADLNNEAVADELSKWLRPQGPGQVCRRISAASSAPTRPE